MKVEISNIPVNIIKNTLLVLDRAMERSTGFFIVHEKGRKRFNKGAMVEIFDELDNIIFRGSIDTAKTKYDEIADYSNISITCIDNHYFVDKRIYAKVHIDEYAGNIVKAIIANKLSDEGIWYDETSIHLGEKISDYYDFKYCNDIIQKLAERCGFIWYIDNDKKLYFLDPQSNENPNIIDDSMIKKDSLEYNDNLKNYRNVQFLKGSSYLTDQRTQMFTYNNPDSIEQTFTLTYKVGELISIEVDRDNNGNWSKLVDTETKNHVTKKYDDPNAVDGVIMYATNENVVTYNRWGDWELENGLSQSSTNEYLLRPISDDDTIHSRLRINYKGLMPLIVISSSYGEIERLKQIESGGETSNGSGKVEAYANEPNLKGLDQATETASSKLEQFGKLDNYSVSLKTRAAGYKAGELVTLNSSSEGINDKLLIEEIRIKDENELIWFNMKLVKGMNNESWQRLFQRKLEQDNVIVNNDEEFTLNETVMSFYQHDKEWTSIYGLTYPLPIYTSDTLYTDENLYATYDLEQVNTCVDITYTVESPDQTPYDETIRIEVTNRKLDEATNTIESTYFIAPKQANGTWKQAKWYSGFGVDKNVIGSGVLTNSVSFYDDLGVPTMKKTVYEAVTMTKKDY